LEGQGKCENFLDLWNFSALAKKKQERLPNQVVSCNKLRKTKDTCIFGTHLIEQLTSSSAFISGTVIRAGHSSSASENTSAFIVTA
jgi:hypothetical protein